MSIWEFERVERLAVDAQSLAAARTLARNGRWSDAGFTGGAVWGRCQGSGRFPYEIVVAVAFEDGGGPTPSTCSCPSRRLPCKHSLALLLRWSAGRIEESPNEADFAASWLRSRAQRSTTPQAERGEVADPEAAARRVATRKKRVDAGLEDLELWLQDQIRRGLAGLERDGGAQLERVAARLVDAQAPGVAGMVRSIAVELGADGWPERVLLRLAALHLLIRAHRQLAQLPPKLAANVRSRVGYPVTRADVLATPGVRDRWVALGAVDTVESQLQTRRVWLYGVSTRRWAVWLSFAPPGMTLDRSLPPGQVLHGDLHFYPGSGLRAVPQPPDDPSAPAAAALGQSAGTDPTDAERVAKLAADEVPTENLNQVRHRFADLLATDPWAGRLPAAVAVAPVPPTQPGGAWRLRDRPGHCVEAIAVPGEPWPMLARSGGEPIPVFGEWSPAGFQPLALLPDGAGGSLSTELV